MDVWLALLLIGLAVVAGGILLRAVPNGILIFLGVLVVFGFGIPAIVIDDKKSPEASGGGASTASGGGSGSQAAAGEQASSGQGSGGGGGGDSAALAQGKQIFTQTCGTCHTLSDAGTNGQVGPVLDQIKPDKARVLAAIKNGGTGSGAMPAGLLSGKEAAAVATYVSTVAGK